MDGIRDITDLNELAEHYARLGDAVQTQLRDLLDLGLEDEGGDYNINALSLISDYLNECERKGVDTGGYADEVNAYLEEAGYARR